MSDRLRDRREDADPVVARAALLVSAARSSEPSDAQLEAAWQALERRRARRRQGASPWYRTALVAGGLLLVVSAAFAAVLVARRSTTSHPPRAGSVLPPVAPARGSPGSPRAGSPAVASPERLAPGSPAADRTAPLPLEATGSAAAPPPRTADRPQHQRSLDPARAVRAAPPSPEAALLLDAINALRRDHDAERAAMLLTYHLDRYRRGRLREEAMVLAIEAAERRGSPDVATFERRYLTSFPGGRFRRVVAQMAARRRAR